MNDLTVEQSLGLGVSIRAGKESRLVKTIKSELVIGGLGTVMWLSGAVKLCLVMANSAGIAQHTIGKAQIRMSVELFLLYLLSLT